MAILKSVCFYIGRHPFMEWGADEARLSYEGHINKKKLKKELFEEVINTSCIIYNS